MKLIVENLDGEFYCYMESEKHHRKVERQRLIKKLTRIHPTSLNGECALEKYGSNFYIVFDLDRP